MPNVASHHLDLIARVAYVAGRRYFHTAWDLYENASEDWETQHACVIPVGEASALYRACVALWINSYGLQHLPQQAA